MNKSLFAGIVTLAIVAGADATTYSQNFNGYDIDEDVAGQDGWSINNTDDQYSVVGNTFVAQGRGIFLGDASMVDTPPTAPTTVTLSHQYSGTMGTLTATFDFAINDSYATGFYNRDSFGVSFTVGTANLLTIAFSPQVPVPTGDPNLDAAWWNVDYTSDYATGGGGQLNMAFEEAGMYQFDLLCAANGSNTDFSLSIDGGNTRVDGGTLALNPLTVTDQFNINWSNTGTNDFGSNIIRMDNLDLIPEPSSSLLLCLAGLGFVTRRRRA
jgi:hypothetical protein